MTPIILFIWTLQIVLESLPISSSGHIHFLGQIVKKYLNKPWPCISEHFEHIMHAPTALVLIFFLGNYVIRMKYGIHELSKLLLYVSIADVMTALIYMLFKQYKIRGECPPNSQVSYGFLVTAFLFLSLYFVPQQHLQLTLYHAILIGIVQGLALLPGVSRLGSTFVVGCWLGLEPMHAFTFSCAIQLPLIIGALAKSFYLIWAHKVETLTFSFFDFAVLLATTPVAYYLLVCVANWCISYQIINLGWYLLMVSILSFWLIGQPSDRSTHLK